VDAPSADEDADAIFEITGLAPAWYASLQSVHRDEAGKFLAEWDGRGARSIGRARGLGTAPGDLVFSCRLVGVARSWFEGSVEGVSVCVLHIPGALERSPELDLLKLCRWACAQCTYVATRAVVSPNVMVILHWTPEPLFEHERPISEGIASLLRREGLWVASFKEFRRSHLSSE